MWRYLERVTTSAPFCRIFLRWKLSRFFPYQNIKSRSGGVSATTYFFHARFQPLMVLNGVRAVLSLSTLAILCGNNAICFENWPISQTLYYGYGRRVHYHVSRKIFGYTFNINHEYRIIENTKFSYVKINTLVPFFCESILDGASATSKNSSTRLCRPGIT